ncbi:MAG: hypothetical protein JO366_20025 [Methylobacteriaceae bacterium]|nr:hypothetical protein [Methylobacteriaceae bacterium]MBV9247092.1 hypothetical protein [Methylobacteriaceae bacterium]MBV9636691.1 hypothetical protein [Methylobacteriaceae bacterium]MBV9704431.1 hypothetical protein [Methylobacteriaceae bacterium]
MIPSIAAGDAPGRFKGGASAGASQVDLRVVWPIAVPMHTPKPDYARAPLVPSVNWQMQARAAALNWKNLLRQSHR